MIRKRSLRPGAVHRARADINVTPLVDVMLVLLVVFMVTAPMLAAGFRVDLPKTRAAAPLQQGTAIEIAIGPGGRIRVDGEETTPDHAVETIEAHLGDDRSRPIRLRADGDAPYRAIVALLDGLASRGLHQVGLVTTSAPPPTAAPVPAATATPEPAR